MTTEPGLVPIGWEYLPSRAARLTLDAEHRWNFRAATLGELRKLAEAAGDASDSITRLAHDLTVRQADLLKRAEANEITAADRAVEDKRLGRELNDYIAQAWWESLTVAFDLLADHPAPNPEDCPAWLYADANEHLKALLRHAKETPPRRGLEE